MPEESSLQNDLQNAMSSTGGPGDSGGAETQQAANLPSSPGESNSPGDVSAPGEFSQPQQQVQQPQQYDSAAAQQQYQSIRDYGKSLGVDLSSYDTDQAAFQALVQAYQQYPQLQQLAQLGNEYLHSQGQQQPQQQIPQDDTPKSWWAPPIDRETAERLISQFYTRDASGELQPLPNAPPTVIKQVSDYAAYIQDWNKKLLHNPKDAIAEAVKEQAQELFQQQFSEQQSVQTSMGILNKHANWLFYKDQSGQPMWGQFTPYGLKYRQLVSQLASSGIEDPNVIDYYALQSIQNELLAQQLQQLQQGRQQPTQQQQPAPQSRQSNQPVQRQVQQPVQQPQSNYEPSDENVPEGAGALTTKMMEALKSSGHLNGTAA